MQDKISAAFESDSKATGVQNRGQILHFFHLQ